MVIACNINKKRYNSQKFSIMGHKYINTSDGNKKFGFFLQKKRTPPLSLLNCSSAPMSRAAHRPRYQQGLAAGLTSATHAVIQGGAISRPSVIPFTSATGAIF